VSVTGRWTRAEDGVAFVVTDDGAQVRGTLAPDGSSRGVYEAFSFVLKREGRTLVGKASIQPKAGGAVEAAWLLRADGADQLVGENEVFPLDPDTGEVVKALGTRHETQGFAIVRPPAPEPPAPAPASPAAPPLEPPAAPAAPAASTSETRAAQKAPGRTGPELLRAIFDALHASDLKALEALTLDADERVTVTGAGKADALGKEIAARLEEDFARFMKENAGIAGPDAGARFLEEALPEPKPDPDCATAQIIESPVLSFEVDGVPRRVTLNLFVKVGDGGWKIVVLLPTR
jgi:hypothetical protein